MATVNHFSGKNALVTGATSGIGYAICEKLTSLGINVYGVGRNFEKIQNAPFEIDEIPLDLNDSESIRRTLPAVFAEIPIHFLIHSAGFGIFRPHEEIAFDDLSRMIDVNLKAPVLITHLLLRHLKETRGTLISITSIEATRHSRLSAAYTATKSGLRDFGSCLFEEVRKSGVKVVNINPDMTDTPFFDTQTFGVGESPDSRLDPDTVADAVEQILTLDENTVITDLTLRPQRFGITKKSNRS